MPKVSVIIPVYGVEKYIERCARSLFEQTLDDIEYIFVDDCTPDKSIEILESIIEEYRLRFAEEKKTVRIVRMATNSGLAAVRRHGIQLATGDYIIHCDSDDWVDVDMYRAMYDKSIEYEADVVICDWYTSDGNSKLAHVGCSNTDKIQFLKEMMFQNKSWAVWNKMVKTTLYDKINYYPTGAMGEDMVLSLQLIHESGKIAYINKPLYYYFTNAASITHTSSPEAVIRKFSQYYSNFRLVEKFFAESPYAKDVKKAINWMRYSVKSELYSTEKSIRSKRRGLFPFVEFKVLLYSEVSKMRKRDAIHNIISSVLNIK